MLSNIISKTDLPPREALPDWLVSFSQSDEYRSLIEQFKAREGAITNTEETAMLYAAIQYLRPACSLEIGTFFAHTARIMAEAIVGAKVEGKLVTIDPFGAERVPDIIKSWPQNLRQVTEFLPWNSMQYFLHLETMHMPKGNDSPLSVILVDGHHNFEYAFYDIMRSADHIAPGGVIFVDNLDQEGCHIAVSQFLKWNPAWKLFAQNRIVSFDTVHSPDFSGFWGALIAPAGIQIAGGPSKFMKRSGISYTSIRGLSLNTIYTKESGNLDVNLSYYALPYDYHITGKGMIITTYKGQQKVSANESDSKSEIIIDFPSPLILGTLDLTNMHVRYELELSYKNESTKDTYLLLDPAEPISLLPI